MVKINLGKRVKKELNLVRQIADFGVISLSAAILQLSMMFIMTSVFGVYYLISGVVSFFITTMISFILNKRFTFHSKAGGIICEERFFGVAFASIFVNVILLYILVAMLGIYYLYSQVVIGLVLFTLHYFVHKYWTFKG
jgi:putative flippase GtrA